MWEKSHLVMDNFQLQEKLTDKELEEVSKLQKQLNEHIDKREISID